MKQRLAMVDVSSPISIRRQCDLLSVSRSSLYYKACDESAENLEIMRLMDEHYFFHSSYGVLRMQDYVDSKGYVANVKRIRRLLRLMGQQAVYPKKNLSKPGETQYKYPYLLKGLEVTRSNQVWQIDITAAAAAYIPMAKGFLYLTAIIDVYSRFVTGWGLSNTLDAKSSHAVLKTASELYGKPEIINSIGDAQSGRPIHLCGLVTGH